MSYCPDCGCKMYNGICTNCHEDLIIFDECLQYDIPMSDEFLNSVDECRTRQREYIKRPDVKRAMGIIDEDYE